MAESFNSNRAIFVKGLQKAFILKAIRILKLNDSQVSSFLHISNRTFFDWKREKFSMSFNAVEKIVKLAKIKMPTNIEIRPAFWSIKKASKLGTEATIKKYGRICQDPEKRKQGWQKWWQSTGQYLKRTVTSPKDIHLPRKSVKLAEFIGIIIGDGGITKYQIKITLNRTSDKQYADFVQKLIFVLFKLDASQVFRESVVNVQVSRKNLVNFCLKLGLKKGNKIKQRVDIPDWIKINQKYALACVRGLVDTDGCFYLHKYKSKGKQYSYKKISFSSHSEPLIKSVKEILEDVGLHPKIDCQGDLRLYNVKEVEQYFKIIGSHNQKHINRFNNKHGELPERLKGAVR